MGAVNAVTTYHVLLNTKEPPDAAIQVQYVTEKASIEIKCSVNGDREDGAPLRLFTLKRGMKNFTEETSSRAENDLTYKVNQFTEMQHAGIYECRVKRKDGKHHLRNLDIRKRYDDIKVPNDFMLCNGTDRRYCENGGSCMQQIKSREMLCVCRPHFDGDHCQNQQIDILPIIRCTNDLKNAQANFAAMCAVSLFLCGMIMVLGYLYWGQRQKMKQMKSKCRCATENHDEHSKGTPHFSGNSAIDPLIGGSDGMVKYFEENPDDTYHSCQTDNAQLKEESISPVNISSAQKRSRLLGTSDSRVMEGSEDTPNNIT